MNNLLVDKEVKITFKRFKDKSSHFWVDNLHLYVDENNEIKFCAGGVLTEVIKSSFEAHIKRNKVKYIPRAKPVEVVVEYLETLKSGKFINKTVSEVFELEKPYLIWMRDKYNFGSQKELERQIKEILKIK